MIAFAAAPAKVGALHRSVDKSRKCALYGRPGRAGGIALGPSLRYVERMENNTPLSPAGGAAPKRFADVPLEEKLAAVMAWLEEHKAARVVRIDMAEQGSFAEALVIASAGSVRHAQSLADGVGELCRASNYEYLRMEGYTAGQWILVDMNDIVVNVFLEPVRELYGLEALWGKAASLASARTGE
jgi:ribosome-associated protein